MLKNIIVLMLMLLNFKVKAAQWFCKEGSSNRVDNTYEVCGIGDEKSESDSRKNSLKNAFEEFDLVCNKSDDCKGKYKQVSPLRTDCEMIKNKFKCYRAFYITVDPNKNSIQSENDLLAQELDRKEIIIQEAQIKIEEQSKHLQSLTLNPSQNSQTLHVNKNTKTIINKQSIFEQQSLFNFQNRQIKNQNSNVKSDFSGNYNKNLPPIQTIFLPVMGTVVKRSTKEKMVTCIVRSDSTKAWCDPRKVDG